MRDHGHESVIVGGEITTTAQISNYAKVARETVTRKISYTSGEYGFDADTCGVIIAVDTTILRTSQ